MARSQSRILDKLFYREYSADISHLTSPDYTAEPSTVIVPAPPSRCAYAGQTDMDGDPRVAYGRVDIGADEFVYRDPIDFDRDMDVDVVDFGFFQACFAGPNRPWPNVGICKQADLNNDGDVDLTDFAIFQSCFNGPNRPPAQTGCSIADFDGDADVDLSDFAAFQSCFNGPNRPPACG